MKLTNSSGVSFDKYQASAIQVNKNAVIKAGAGSGKTTVLAARFLHLVKDLGYSPAEILTLTFTKKAATEMSSRIYCTLKKNLPSACRVFYKASISTLDSYCNSICRTSGYLYGIPPSFTIDDEYIEEKTKDLALNCLLEYKDNIGVKLLLASSNIEETCVKLLSSPMKNSFLTNKIDFISLLEEQASYILTLWNTKLFEAKGAYANLIFAINNYLKIAKPKKDSVTYERLKEALSVKLPEDNLTLTREQLENSEYTAAYNFTFLLDKVTNSVPLTGGRVTDEDKIAAKALLKQAKTRLKEDLIPKLKAAVLLIQSFIYNKALTPIYIDLQERVCRLKRSNAVLTFLDVSHMALSLLTNYPEIRRREKEKFRAIMIDEFQDNNALQKDLLFLLAEKIERSECTVPESADLIPNKLFFVGDEKQSIYLFRGADVSVFKELSKSFPEGVLPLNTNYRSTSCLISAFNSIFGGTPYANKEKDMNAPSVFYSSYLLNNVTSLVPSYEAIYEEVLPPASTTSSFPSPCIHLALYPLESDALDDDTDDDNEKEEPEERDESEEEVEEEEESKERFCAESAEALWVAYKIKEIVTGKKQEESLKEEEKTLKDGKESLKDGGGKTYSYSDIAILLRNTSLQSLYEKVFMAEGIPYNTESIKGFFRDGVPCDLYNYLKILVDTSDKGAYEKVLISPYVSLSIKEALSVIKVEAAPFTKTSEVETLLSPSSYAKYLTASETYKKLSSLLLSTSIANIITYLWYNAGYRYEVIWNKALNMYEKNFDILFELAVRADKKGQNLSTFTKSIATYIDDNKKLEDMNIPLLIAGGVNILTIHASKGLEFPIVFIPATHKKGYKDKNMGAAYFSTRYGISVNLPFDIAAFNKSKENKNLIFIEDSILNLAKEEAELRRLTYVALTRAIDEIYITNGKYTQNPTAALEYNVARSREGEVNSKVDTIYKVLEPVINYYYDKKITPFTTTFIPSYSVKQVYENRKGTLTISKSEFIKQIDKLEVYKKAAVINDFTPPINYITPSTLDGKTSSSKGKKAVLEEDRYRELDAIIKEYQIDFSDYGTLTHALISILFNYLREKLQELRGASIDEGLKKRVSEAIEGARNKAVVTSEFSKFFSKCKVNKEKEGEGKEENSSAEKEKRERKEANAKEGIIEAAFSMAKTFFLSSLGLSSILSKEARSEASFKALSEEGGRKSVIDCKIDLYFLTESGFYQIVDFKTDKTIKAEQYKEQLSYYRYIISKLHNFPERSVKCNLFFLRIGESFPLF